MNNAKNYFSWSELTATDTGLFNNPTSPFYLANLARLWYYLNSLRERLGEPIFINSAFRTPAVNEQVGGSECSFHMQGKAADIRTSESSRERLLTLLQCDHSCGYITEFIVYPTFIHIAL